MFGSGLIGCIPLLRANVPDGKCDEYLNSLSRQFNKALSVALRDLSAKHKGFSYTVIDAYGFVSLLSSEPMKYGANNLSCSFFPVDRRLQPLSLSLSLSLSLHLILIFSSTSLSSQFSIMQVKPVKVSCLQ